MTFLPAFPPGKSGMFSREKVKNLNFLLPLVKPESCSHSEYELFDNAMVLYMKEEIPY